MKSNYEQLKAKFFLLLWMILFFPLTSLQGDDYGFTDPYPQVYENVTLLPLYRHGWNLHDKQVRDALSKRKVMTVVELGSWTGNWTIFIAQHLPEGGRVFAVDNWRPKTAIYNPNSSEMALLPIVFPQFLSNVIHCNMQSKIIPVRMDTVDAAAKFQKLGIRPDLIYVDAGHDYASVYNDIESWRPLLAEGGLLCGDDWNLGDVPFAVKDYAWKHHLKVCHEGEFWWYENN